MAGKDIIIMRQKELKRLHVIHKVMEGELTHVEAAGILLNLWYAVKSLIEVL